MPSQPSYGPSVSQFTFFHDALVWLGGTFYLIYKLAVAFRQSSCDDACPSCNLQAGDWNKKYCLTDIELMHGASLKLLHYRTHELLYPWNKA
jgi:hypothetical protein